MKKKSFILLIGLCALLSACGDKPESFGLGTSVYRPGFLWTDQLWADTTYVEQAFLVSTEGFAENRQKLRAEILLTDNEGKKLDLSKYEVWVNQKRLSESCFGLSSQSQDTVFLKLRCLPSKDLIEGRQDVVVKLRANSNVDKTNCVNFGGETAIDSHKDTLVGRLSFVYDKKWNIGDLILAIIILLIVAGIVLWFVLFQRLKYPRFKNINKMIIIPNQAPISIHFKGVRMVVLDNTKHKQSWWNKMWTGKIIYKQHLAITSPIMLTPTGRGKKIRFRAANPSNYTCSPNPIAIQPSKVTDIVNKQQITIQ